jgi:hypothetical protein
MSNEVEIIVKAKNRTKEGLVEARRDTKTFAEEIEHRIESSGDTSGKSFGAKLAGRFKELPIMANPYGAAIGAALGAAMLPALGAALNGGALLAVGGGAIALGIKSAANDPGVQSAWKSFADKGKSLFADFGKPFVGPVRDSIGIFGKTLDALRPGLLRIGAAASKVVEPLAKGFGELAKNAMPGIEKAVKASVPLFTALAKNMPDLGRAVSSFFESMAKGAPGALKFFDGLLKGITKVLTGLGKAVGGLSEAFDTMSSDSRVIKVFKGIGDVLSWVGRMIRNVASGALEALRPAFAELSKTFSDNRAELTTLRKGLGRMAEFIADRVAPVVGRILVNNLRLTIRAIGAVISALGWMVRTFQSARRAASRAGSGISSTFRSLQATMRRVRAAIRSALSGIFDPLIRSASRAYSSVVGKLQGIASFASSVVDHIPGFAAGGPVGSGGLVEVGEHGRELVRLPSGSSVIPNANAQGSSGQGGGNGPASVRLEVASSGGRMADLLVEVLREAIRGRGGSVQAVLGS